MSIVTTGKPVSHTFAKELLAGFAGAEVDKLAETKGENWFDRERSKHEAKKRAENLYDQHYGGNGQYDPLVTRHPTSYENMLTSLSTATHRILHVN
jgi:hypothetical protein